MAVKTLKIPCQDCVCFAICNSKRKNHIRAYLYIYRLTTKCSILDEFVDKSDEHTFKEKLNKLIIFFGLKNDERPKRKWTRKYYQYPTWD